METKFIYGFEERQLGFKLRQKITTRYGIELKGNGQFNTVSGNLQYRGTAMKCLTTGVSLKDERTPFILGVGVAAVSGLNEPLLTVKAKKTLPLLDDYNTILSGKVIADVQVNGHNVTRRGTLKMSHKLMNFTRKQDLKLTAGVDVFWPPGDKRPNTTPLFQLRENNWGLHFRNHGWSVTYDL